MDTNNDSPPISIAFITIDGRELALSKLLLHLKMCCLKYPGTCQLVACNNSDASFMNTIRSVIAESGIEETCEVLLLQSDENNIALARTLLFKESMHDWLAFIDDDEYPEENWLMSLSEALKSHGSDIVAGPVVSKFPKGTPNWIVNSDLHNTKKRVDGTEIDYTNTGNVLINKPGVPDPIFDRDFGKSGGSDTEFFQRNIDLGMVMTWTSEALVFEDVDRNRANTKFMIRRFMNQGSAYRRIKTLHGKISNQTVFSTRAYAVGLLSIPIAVILLLLKHESAGLWLKRAFSNLGKVISPSRLLYD